MYLFVAIFHDLLSLSPVINFQSVQSITIDLEMRIWTYTESARKVEDGIHK